MPILDSDRGIILGILPVGQVPSVSIVIGMVITLVGIMGTMV